MRLKLISCEAFAPEVLVAIRRSVNRVDARFLPRSLHRLACLLRRQRLQEFIDTAEASECQALLVAYGFCGYGIIGLKAGRVPLVIPRAQGCPRFWQGETRTDPHCCRCDGDGVRRDVLAVANPGGPGGGQRLPNGKPLRGGDPKTNSIPGSQLNGEAGVGAPSGSSPSPVGGTELVEIQAREEAKWFGWDFELAHGELGLVQRFVDGYWSHHEFLVIPPGWSVAAKSGTEITATEEAIA